MISLTTRVDVSGPLKMLNGLKASLKDKIAARAINRIADQVKTKATNEIYNEFNLPRAKILQRIKIRKAFARANVIQAEISVPEAGGKYRALHLTDLRGTKDLRYSSGRIGGQTLRMARRDRKGKVTTKGGVQYTMLKSKGKQTLPNAFIAPGKNSGKMIVFQRENLNDPRSKLKAVYRIDVPQMFNTKRLKADLTRLIREKLPGEIERLMRLEISRGGS